MSLEGDSQVNSKSGARDHETGNERRKTQDKLPIGNPLQPPPAPPANPPPDNKPSQRRENTKLGLEIIGLAVLIAYTIFSGLQWLQIRWTNRLTREALNGSNVSLQQTLQKMQNQIDQMSRLADNAGRQADRTKDLADRAHDQAVATKQAADAATSAATTAKASLHVSERAYVINGAMSVDIDKGLVHLPISNTGHIPSGVAVTVVHTATAIENNPLRPFGPPSVTECTWKSHRVESIPQGNPYTIEIPLHKIDKEKLNTGVQGIYVAGYIEYNDGFPDSPHQEWAFCDRTTYSVGTKQLSISPCDSAIYLPKMEKCDGYPNNEERD